MSSFESEYSARMTDREGRVEEYIRGSSPMLVWQGDKGIYLIAPNKRPGTRRVYTFLDRFALLSRGTSAAGSVLATRMAATAWGLVPEWTLANVPVDRTGHDIGLLLQECLHQFSVAPIMAEAVLVEVKKEMRGDFLSYITYRGDEKPFEKALLLGTVNPSPDAVDKDVDLSKDLQTELRGKWRTDATYEQIIETVLGLDILHAHPTIAEQFGNGPLETVLMSRDAIREKRIYEVVQRTDQA